MARSVAQHRAYRSRASALRVQRRPIQRTAESTAPCQRKWSRASPSGSMRLLIPILQPIDESSNLGEFLGACAPRAERVHHQVAGRAAENALDEIFHEVLASERRGLCRTINVRFAFFGSQQ